MCLAAVPFSVRKKNSLRVVGKTVFYYCAMFTYLQCNLPVNIPFLVQGKGLSFALILIDFLFKLTGKIKIF